MQSGGKSGVPLVAPLDPLLAPGAVLDVGVRHFLLGHRGLPLRLVDLGRAVVPAGDANIWRDGRFLLVTLGPKMLDNTNTG